jgi:hypothetical protein
MEDERRLVRVAIEHGERPISAAEPESSSALCIERHPVIVFAPGRVQLRETTKQERLCGAI